MPNIFGRDPGRKGPTQQQDTHVPPTQRVRLRPDQIMPPTPWVGQGTVEIARGPGRIPTAEVERLKALNPGDVLETAGLVASMRKEGRDTRYYLRDGAQVIVTGELFNDVTSAHRYHGRGAITLAQQILGTEDFRAAIAWLREHFPGVSMVVDGQVVAAPAPPPPPDSFSSQPKLAVPFELPDRSVDSAEITKSWLEKRGIPSAWADMLISGEHVYAEDFRGHHNIVWPMLDENRIPVAALRRGVDSAPGATDAFKGKVGRGGAWELQYSTEIRRMVLFESPLDAVSYQVLRGYDAHTVYASLGGLSVLDRFIESARASAIETVIAVDRDPAGDTAWSQLAARFPGLKREVPERKDWNDDLRLGPLPPPKSRSELALEKYLEPKNDRQRKEVTDELLCFKRFAGDSSMTDARAFEVLVASGPAKVDAYLEHELGRGLSKATINNKRSRIKKLVEAARAENLADWSVQPVSPPKKAEELREVKPVSPATELVMALSTPVNTPAAPNLELRARQLMTDWLASRNSPNTTRNYADSVIALQNFCAATGRAADAPEEAIACLLREGQPMVDAFRAHELGRGLQPSTVRNRMTAIASLARMARDQTLCTWALKTDWKHLGPTKNMNGPTRESVDACIKDLQRQATDPRRRAAAVRDVAILEIGSRAGLRVSEIASLGTHDVMEHAGKIDLWAKRKGERLRVGVPIDEPTRTALMEYMTQRGNKPGPLFLAVDPRGTKYSDQGLTAARMGKLVHELGLGRAGDVDRKSGIHGLRHLAAEQVMQATGDMREVAKALGHRDPRMSSTAQYLRR